MIKIPPLAFGETKISRISKIDIQIRRNFWRVGQAFRLYSLVLKEEKLFVEPPSRGFFPIWHILKKNNKNSYLFSSFFLNFPFTLPTAVLTIFFVPDIPFCITGLHNPIPVFGLWILPHHFSKNMYCSILYFGGIAGTSFA